MKIKTILKLGVILSSMIILVLGMWVLSISKNYEATKRNADIARKVNSSIFKLSILSSDYLLYYQERAAIQWKQTYSRLNKILANEDVNHLNKFIDLKLLMKKHTQSLKLFERLEKVRSEELINNTPLLHDQRKALSSQLLSTSQLISHTATQLADTIELKRSQIEEQLFWLAIFTFVIFIFTLLASWYLIASRIVLPVVQLTKHIANVDVEHLDERFKIVRNDEVGELTTTFNTLIEDLFNTVVSKAKLMQEVDERIKSEEELIKQQNLNASVLEGAGNIITILDTDGNFVKFNRAAEELTGYSRAELIGKPVWDFVIPREQKEGVQTVFEALKKGETKFSAHYENHWTTKKGEYRLIEWHNTIIRNQLNEVIYIVAIGYDVTEKRHNEVEKQRIERELNQSRKMESLGKLTGGIAHDFNNMLAIVLGYTELALDYAQEKEKPQLTSYLEQIHIASNRAKDLISKMLAFSRVDNASSHSIQLSPLLDENLLLMQSMLPSTIKVELSKEDNTPEILMDPVQFQQIFMNLMINAKDAMDGSGVIKITLGRYVESNKECSSCHKIIKGDWVELTFSDTGRGMTKEVKERIFEPFFTTKKLGEGTGMGMSVLHGVVKGHNGHIIIDSTLGQGTSFHLLFPPSSDINYSGVDFENNRTISVQGSGERILIIDDQEALADMQYDLLKEYGYQCTKKYNSEDALELFLGNPEAYDLIITDQTMPNLTGLEIINTIRDKNFDIPIIISTGYSEKIKDSKLEIKNVTLLKKPTETKVLLDNVARSIKLYKM